MKCKLNDICSFANEKIDVALLSKTSYISTENMLPNKAGITTATSLPTVNQTQAFKSNDVLISNIRPYFKKIWYATFDGGCSNDVLVLRANADIDPHYLYYLLADDVFFDYATATAKGTKMPRGDKAAIMKFEVNVYDIAVQRKIVSLLADIDAKIALNNDINCNLQNQAQALFKSWFIDFEPFGGSAPSEWCESTFGQIAVLKTDSWSPTKNPNELIEHYSIPALDEQHYPVFETSSDIKSNKYIINSNSVMISKLNPDTKRIWRPLCITDNSVCSTEFIVFEARKKEHKDFVYSILDSTPFLNYLCSHTTGSTNSRQRANPKSTLDYSLLLPPDTVVNNFCHIVTPMYDLINANIIENQELSKTRDILLPKLMNGEIDVSEVEI